MNIYQRSNVSFITLLNKILIASVFLFSLKVQPSVSYLIRQSLFWKKSQNLLSGISRSQLETKKPIQFCLPLSATPWWPHWSITNGCFKARNSNWLNAQPAGLKSTVLLYRNLSPPHLRPQTPVQAVPGSCGQSTVVYATALLLTGQHWKFLSLQLAVILTVTTEITLKVLLNISSATKCFSASLSWLCETHWATGKF